MAYLVIRGVDRHGHGHYEQRTSPTDLPQLVERHYRARWKWMTVERDGLEVGAITDHPDTGQRVWWAERSNDVGVSFLLLPDGVTGLVLTDGGRAAAGFKGETGDCVTRSIAIATERPYREVYDAINEAAKRERPRSGRSRSSARTGVHNRTTRRYMDSIGWEWHPTMQIGQGCTVHLRADELPPGRLVVQTSKHITAMIDGVIYDTYDPSREGTRCVYGYWTKGSEPA